jgi:hypothetical protein
MTCIFFVLLYDHAKREHISKWQPHDKEFSNRKQMLKYFAEWVNHQLRDINKDTVLIKMEIIE